MTLPNKLCFVDVETTGMRATYDRVIDIGILRVEDGELVKTFETLVNPGDYVPAEILEMTGIIPTELEAAPYFREVKDEILETLADCIFVAHNVRFDYSFLKNEFKRQEKSFSPKHFCTVKLSRALFPEYRHHNLDSIIERFNFECQRRHRAFDDAQVLWDFYQKSLEMFSLEKMTEALNKALKKPSLPVSLKPEVVENLPEGPGVYIFYGASGVPLYVGKSINIKERVMSHFAADHSNPTEMKISQQVESIETIETSGELGALFKESELVKKMQPLYNRKLRLKRKLVVLKRVMEDGYESIVLEELDKIEVSDLESVLGIFRSRAQAKQLLLNAVKQYGLCEKLLKLEKTKGACFNYRLGRCKGACVQKEIPLKYNFRFYEAFSTAKIQRWPFNGPILIKEQDPETEKFEGFLIDQWCYLGSVKKEGKEVSHEYNFDLDTYKILQSYLRVSKNLSKIKQLTHQENVSYLSS
jgi:DNA polymerase III subunit epsilon